ncbi:MAG: hypothetical protein RL156_1703 [Bacteroidota bacterium]|jgi:hypothetical protein
MANRFASGKFAIAECDICGQRYKLKQLKTQVVKTKQINVLACPECWSPDHPQLQLGMYPVEDPQALRNPRRDLSYIQSGITTDGSIGEGSRVIQWGWAPVGGASLNAFGLTPNDLVARGRVGQVTVTV